LLNPEDGNIEKNSVDAGLEFVVAGVFTPS